VLDEHRQKAIGGGKAETGFGSKRDIETAAPIARRRGRKKTVSAFAPI
jgi:hypothetical protein